MKKLFLIAIVAIIIAAQARPAEAAMVPMQGRWSDLNLTYRFSNRAVCDQIGMTAPIRTAMTEWEGWLGRSIFTEATGTNATRFIYICSLQSKASPEDLGQMLDPLFVVPASTQLYSGSQNRTIIDYAEVTFYALASVAPVIIAAHELGHVLGLLGDYENCASLMCTHSKVSDLSTPRQPTQDDIDTLKAVYATTLTPPPTTPSNPPANATTTPPSSTPHSSPPPNQQPITPQAAPDTPTIRRIVNLDNAPYALLFGIVVPASFIVFRRRNSRKQEETQLPPDTVPAPKDEPPNTDTPDLKTLPSIREMEKQFTANTPPQSSSPVSSISPSSPVSAPPSAAQSRKTSRPKGMRKRVSGYLKSYVATSAGVKVAEIEPSFITAEPAQFSFPVAPEATDKVLSQQGMDEAGGRRGIVDFTIENDRIVDVKRRATRIVDNIPERKNTPGFSRRGRLNPVFAPYDPNRGETKDFECLLRSICTLEDLDWERVLANRKHGLDNARKGWSTCAELAPWASDAFRWVALTEHTGFKSLKPTPDLLWKMRGRGIVMFSHPTKKHAVVYEAGNIYDPYNLRATPETLNEVITRWSPKNDWHIMTVIPQPFTFEHEMDEPKTGETITPKLGAPTTATNGAALAPSSKPARHCPDCGRALENYARFCDKCGLSLTAAPTISLSTTDVKGATRTQRSQSFCRYCGTALATDLRCPKCRKVTAPEERGGEQV